MVRNFAAILGYKPESEIFKSPSYNMEKKKN